MSVAISVWLLTGCAGWQRPDGAGDITPEAQALLDDLAVSNTALANFKGLGSFRRKDPKGAMAGRLVWACIRPDRFRTDILDISGRSVITIAGNGQWFYARIRGESNVYKRPATGATIERVAGAPVAIDDLIALLGGRIPIRNFRRAFVASVDGEGPVLVLKGRLNRPVERVYFHNDARSCRRVVIYTDAGEIAYQVEIGPTFEQDGYSFFRTLVFTDGQENRLELRMEKVWTEVDLSPSLFELKQPSREGK